MKSLLLKISVTLGCLIFWAGIATAVPIEVGDTDDLTGYLTTAPDQPSGNKDHKDNEYNVNALVNLYNAANDPDLPTELTLLGKWDVGKGWDEGKDPGFTGGFSDGAVNNEDPDFISGSWSAPTGWLASDPIYYSLKAADHFALYYANGDTSGTWEIDWTKGKNGSIPDLSHISFWTTTNSTNQVPEPGTLALVGLGLATIAGYRRKRHSR